MIRPKGVADSTMRSWKLDRTVLPIDTAKPQEGTWTLIAPDGRKWQDTSPIRVVRKEQRERVPAEVGLQRILDAMFSLDD